MARQKKLKPHELREILRASILKSGLTVYEVCKRAGVDQPQVHRFLAGGDVRLATAEKLCVVLGLQLVQGEKPET